MEMTPNRNTVLFRNTEDKTKGVKFESVEDAIKRGVRVEVLPPQYVDPRAHVGYVQFVVSTSDMILRGRGVA